MLKISEPIPFRENIRKKLNGILNNETQCINLEKGIYNFAIKEANQRKIIKKWENPHFTQLYVDRLRSIYINLKMPDLLEQIKNREIKPENVAFRYVICQF